MVEWHDFSELHPEHTVEGTVKVCRDVYSPTTDDHRDLQVYLPPTYASSEARYPVLYMHDGQNLFDEATSHAGEWRVDENFAALSAEGIEAIVVGIPNVEKIKPSARLTQYGAFHSYRFDIPPEGDAYLAFVCETVKPLIDAEFRTKPERAHTGIMGSSMGGLISFYAYFHCPTMFGFAGVMSPAFWVTGDDAFFTYAEQQPHLDGKLYMDIGTDELGLERPEDQRPGIDSELYLTGARRMHEILLMRGYQPGEDYLYVEEKDALHHEIAWARRFPDAMRFWLK